MLNYTTILGAILVLLTALFLVRAWNPGRFRIRDRVGGLAELLALITGFALLRATGDWAHAPLLIWVVAVALTAGGAALLALRFPALPWLRERRRHWPRVVRLTLGSLLSAAIIVVALAQFH